MDLCPCCERPFERVSDYPFVYVAKVERFPLPSETQFLIHDPDAFLGPKWRCGDQRPPKQVLEFFKGNSEAQEYEYEGWTWKLGIIPLKAEDVRISLSDKLKQFFGVPIKAPEAWEIGLYRRSQKDSSRKVVIKHVVPYLNHLETLVGKEVPSKEVFPKFSDLKWGYSSRIPETQYDVALEELTSTFEADFLIQAGLQVPKLETEKPSRKIAFCITETDDDSSEIKYLSVLGGMVYEGRLKR